MAKFVYRAVAGHGKTERGTVDALNQEEAIGNLQREGLVVTQIAPAPEDRVRISVSKQKMHAAVKIDDLILFGRQLSTLLEAGVPLLRSLDIITQQIDSQKLVDALNGVRASIEQGETFSRALAAHPKIFNNFWVNLVETGEASGHLPSSMDQLVQYLEASGELRRKVSAAMVYPSILVGVSTAAISVFLVRVIPIFAEIFAGFDMELPALTQGVISVSDWVNANILWMILGGGGCGVGVKMLLRTERGRILFDTVKMRVPILGDLMRMIGAARFAQGLGTLIRSGVPLLHGLEIVTRTSDSPLIVKALDHVKREVRDGRNMSAPLEESGVFPLMVTQMIAVGEEIGELGQMLDRVAVFFNERISFQVDRLTTLIEPVILVAMGIIIGVLVVAMFLPIFQLSNIG